MNQPSNDNPQESSRLSSLSLTADALKINFPPPCFPGTDVPLVCFFIHLQHGYSIAQFLQDFPTVSKDQVEGLAAMAIEIFKHPVILDILEEIASDLY